MKIYPLFDGPLYCAECCVEAGIDFEDGLCGRCRRELDLLPAVVIPAVLREDIEDGN